MKRLFVISGSSGVGKGTVIKEFLKKYPSFSISISCTTRNIRPGEIDGLNYFFLTKEEFQKSIENDEFLEWTEFSDNFYGTKRRFVQEMLDTGKNVLLELDTLGALNVKKLMPDSVLIFIAPPSFKELENRLRGRNTETDDIIEKRLKQTAREKRDSEKYDHIIVNDTISAAVEKLGEIINLYLK